MIFPIASFHVTFTILEDLEKIGFFLIPFLNPQMGVDTCISTVPYGKVLVCQNFLSMEMNPLL